MLNNNTIAVQDFNSFVFTQGEDIKTTSLIIAEKFSKSHTHVIRDIEKIMTQVSDIFNKTNFGLIEEDVKVGFGTRKDKAYELTKDGFIMVVMSYTGAKAFAIKESYINAFNFMLAKLKPVPNALRDLPPKTLTPAMKRHINSRVNWLAKNQVGASYASLGKLIQETFNVNKRELIPAAKYPDVCALLNCEPDPKALQGELVEPVKLEYQPPAGMVLIAESELANLQKKPTSTWQNHATMILSSKGDGDAIYSVHFKDGSTVITEQPENVMIGTPEKIIADLQDLGFVIFKNEPENKLETIVKIASGEFVA